MNFPLCLTQTGRGPMFGNAKMQDGMLQTWCRFQRPEARERLRWKVKTCLVIHTKLFQQQLYNPDLKPVLYMPALSEVGFHRSHYLFSINSCQTLLSNVPPVNQSIAATHRNQDKVPLVITAKSKICTYIQVRQHLCMADRESGQSCKTCSVIRLHHQCTLSFLNYICIKYQAPT